MGTPCAHGEAKDQGDITALIQWKKHTQVIKSELLEQMHSQDGDLLDKTLKEAAHAFPQSLRNSSAEMQSREKGLLQKEQKRKVFIAQPSLLEGLLEHKDVRSIYNMFLAVFCLLALCTVVVDSIDAGWLVLDFKIAIFAFGNLSRAWFTWLWMFLYSLFVPYKFLQMWASSLRTAKYPRIITATTAVVLLVCHAAVLGFYPVYTVIYYNLGPASCAIVILEQMRFIMKTHSFLRESVPPILYARTKEGKIQPPEFSTYLYFLFCPTLIYRESYPRTSYVRWKYVIKNFAQFLSSMLCVSFILERLCIPLAINMSQQPLTLKTAVLSILGFSLPGTLSMLIFFFGFLHCWLNTFAEMLRFADRAFYKDWWNSTSLPAFYRKWNVVVHDWLYCYIYQELLWLLGGKSKATAMMLTFFFSAFLHDYTYSLCFGFFIPVFLIVLAICGVIFTFIIHDKRTNPAWNVLFWVTFIWGQGTHVFIYSKAWYAKVHCPLQKNTFWGLVTPTSWSCNT